MFGGNQEWKTHTKCSYIHTHNLFLGSGLGNTDEEGDDIVSPAQLIRNAIARVRGYTYLLICSAISASNVNSQKQKPT